jgi:hypothetical protein
VALAGPMFGYKNQVGIAQPRRIVAAVLYR